VLARTQHGQGFVELNPVTVFRLRHAIDDAIGSGMGRALIETGTSNEYRLTISMNDLRGSVALTPCFFELVQLNIVSRDKANKLEEAVSSEITKQS